MHLLLQLSAFKYALFQKQLKLHFNFVAALLSVGWQDHKSIFFTGDMSMIFYTYIKIATVFLINIHVLDSNFISNVFNIETGFY